VLSEETDESPMSEQLNRHILELEAVTDVIKAASSSLEPRVLMEQMAEVLKKTTQLELIAIYLRDGDTLNLASSTVGMDKAIVEAGASFIIGEGVTGAAAESGEDQVVPDLAAEKRIPEETRKVLFSSGLSSLISVPIKTNSEVLGVITAMSPSTEICSEERIRFMEMLADQLGISIRNSRLFSEVERSGQFLKSLLDSMDEGAYTLDLERYFTYLNAASEKITGYPPDELIGQHLSLIIPQDQMPMLQEMMARRNAGYTDRYDIDLVQKGGTRITVNQTVAPLFFHGEVAGVVGVAADVTGRRQMEARIKQQQRRLSLLQSIMEKSVSGLARGKALKTLADEISEAFGYEFCNIFMLSPDQSGLRIFASHGYSDEVVKQLNQGDSFSFSNEGFIITPAAIAFREGRQSCIKDVLNESTYAVLLDVARKHGFSSVCATPLEYRGERLGALLVHTREIHAFDEEELGFLASIAAEASAIAGSARVYRQLARSEERYRDLYNSAADWMYTIDPDGVIIECNETMVNALKIPRERLIGGHMYDFETESDRKKAMARLDEFREKNEPGMSFTSERVFIDGEGGQHTIEVHAQSVSGNGGDHLQWRAVGRDITTERQMTREILRRNRELAVLNAAATTAAASLDLDSTLQATIKSVVDSMKYDTCIVFLLDPSGMRVRLRASIGAPADMLERISTMRVGEGYAGKIAATGEPMFAEDSPGNPDRLPGLPEKPWFESFGGVPLVSKDKLLGVMIVGKIEHHEFDDAERQLLIAVGKTIGVAIDNARLFKDVVRGGKAWETTFNAMTDGVSIHDKDFNIIRVNQSLVRLLGIPADELIGRKCHEVFHGLDHPVSGCPMMRTLKEGGSCSLDVEEIKLGRILHISTDPVFDDHGNISGVVHGVRDITEQEQLRDQLTQSEKIRALGEMAGGVAHDFNNFLTVILGNAQLLLSQCDDSNQESIEALNSIFRAANDAAETVRRIQEFTRVRTTRTFTTVDLNKVIGNAIDVARPRWRDEADTRGVKMEIETKFDELPPVNANEAELGEVMVNLILNAADALVGGGAIVLRTRVEPGGEWVRAEVSDTGEGMDEEVCKRVFEPFYTTKGVRGTGLGLSVAYGIINRHGGEITVDSQRGKGTTFIVRLPVATVADLSVASEVEAEPTAVRPARVLVIDDAPMIRTLMSDMLDNMGHTCEVAESGPRGLDLFDAADLANDPFDVVFTDLGMPEMSGWEVVSEIKQRSPQTPVALITGWGDQLNPERMEASGVDMVIAKPFKVEDIRRLLAKAFA